MRVRFYSVEHGDSPTRGSEVSQGGWSRRLQTPTTFTLPLLTGSTIATPHFFGRSPKALGGGLISVQLRFPGALLVCSPPAQASNTRDVQHRGVVSGCSPPTPSATHPLRPTTAITPVTASSPTPPPGPSSSPANQNCARSGHLFCLCAGADPALWPPPVRAARSLAFARRGVWIAQWDGRNARSLIILRAECSILTDA